MHFLSKLPACTSFLHRYVGIRQLSTELIVGELSYDTNEPILKKAFEEHGEVINVKVICDPVSGRSSGYGFVKYADQTAAAKALKEMDRKLLEGRRIRVRRSRRAGAESSLLPDSQTANGSSLETTTVTEDTVLDSEN